MYCKNTLDCLEDQLSRALLTELSTREYPFVTQGYLLK